MVSIVNWYVFLNSLLLALLTSSSSVNALVLRTCMPRAKTGLKVRFHFNSSNGNGILAQFAVPIVDLVKGGTSGVPSELSAVGKTVRFPVDPNEIEVVIPDNEHV